MKKILMITVALVSLFSEADAQLKRTWKRQIYGGYNKTLRSEVLPECTNVDLNLASKHDWLFNTGFTHSKYKSKLNQASFTGIPVTAKPSVTIQQFNFSAGRRFDFRPKWSISALAGLSYTKCTYPVSIQHHFIKVGGLFLFEGTGAQMATAQALGIHLNGELNYNVSENMMLHAGYMYDFNSAHKTGGFTMGIRIGVIKQKNGARNISRINL